MSATDVRLETVDVGGLRMRVASQGEGPLVLLCHGFPESWRSWRSQLEALAEAGFRAAAPDMRGYGGTDAPESPDAYTMVHHAGDMVGLVQALGESQAVIVGHDWGAPEAWNSALLRPDMFRAVVGMSAPYTPPSHSDHIFMQSLDVTAIWVSSSLSVPQPIPHAPPSIVGVP
jgi:pimeloyl-ACP methyl ester carboxylesterase